MTGHSIQNHDNYLNTRKADKSLGSAKANLLRELKISDLQLGAVRVIIKNPNWILEEMVRAATLIAGGVGHMQIEIEDLCELAGVNERLAHKSLARREIWHVGPHMVTYHRDLRRLDYERR